MANLNTLRSKGWMGIGTTGSLLSNCATYLKTASAHLYFLTRLHFTILKIAFFADLKKRTLTRALVSLEKVRP